MAFFRDKYSYIQNNDFLQGAHMSTFLSTFAIRLADEFRKRESIANKGKPNGYASLDATGKVPLEQLNIQKITALPASVNTLLSSATVYKNVEFEIRVTTFNLSSDDTLEVISSNNVSLPLTNIVYDITNKTVTAKATVTNNDKLYTIGFRRFGYLQPSTAQITIVDRTWIDLRTGNTLPPIRTRNVHTIQTSRGVYFTETSPPGYTGPQKYDAGWGEWIKFEDLIWKRADKKTLEVIMYMDTAANSSTFMFGLGSTTMSETSNTQYWDGDQLLYANSYDIKQYYGGGGVSNWSYDIPYRLPSAGYYKFKWLNNGSTVEIYNVTTSDNWLDESKKVTTFTIPTNRTNPANSTNLMLMFVAPSSTIDMLIAAYRVY